MQTDSTTVFRIKWDFINPKIDKIFNKCPNSQPSIQQNWIDSYLTVLFKENEREGINPERKSHLSDWVYVVYP